MGKFNLIFGLSVPLVEPEFPVREKMPEKNDKYPFFHCINRSIYFGRGDVYSYFIEHYSLRGDGYSFLIESSSLNGEEPYLENFGTIFIFILFLVSFPFFSLLIKWNWCSPRNPGPGCQQKKPLPGSNVEPIGNGEIFNMDFKK